MSKTNVTIEKAPIDVDGKLEQRKQLAENLEAKLNNFKKELEGKTYLVEGKEETAKTLLDFVTSSAKWSFSESMGVIEVAKQLEAAVKDLSTGKRKELMLDIVALEALYYFVSKETGVGLESATTFFNQVIKPISSALSRAKMDRDKRDQMEKDLALILSAIDQGAISEMEEKLLAEIEAETAE
jgi:hypothetical protein